MGERVRIESFQAARGGTQLLVLLVKPKFHSLGIQIVRDRDFLRGCLFHVRRAF
jgi:hypothetical protein